MFTLVTAHRLGRLQRCQPIEPEAPQNAADGRWRDAQFGCDLLAGVALAAETPDLGDHRLRRRPMQPIGPRTAITQSSQALAAISGNPFANGPRADACGFADGLRRLPALNLSYNSLSTVWRQTGILVHVHPVLPWNLKSQQPQLPRSEPDGQPVESSHLGLSRQRAFPTPRERQRGERRAEERGRGIARRQQMLVREQHAAERRAERLA